MGFSVLEFIVFQVYLVARVVPEDVVHFLIGGSCNWTDERTGEKEPVQLSQQ